MRPRLALLTLFALALAGCGAGGDKIEPTAKGVSPILNRDKGQPSAAATP